MIEIGGLGKANKGVKSECMGGKMEYRLKIKIKRI